MSAARPDGLIRHEPTGWLVDPRSGAVYTAAGSWAGKRLGSLDAKGHLRAGRRDRDGSQRIWRLKRVVWEAVIGHPLPTGWTLVCSDGDQTNVAFDNLRLVSLGALRRGGRKLSPEALASILAARGRITAAELGRRYGVSESYVWHLWSGHPRPPAATG